MMLLLNLLESCVLFIKKNKLDFISCCSISGFGVFLMTMGLK